jgi:hypothetical protein
MPFLPYSYPALHRPAPGKKHTHGKSGPRSRAKGQEKGYSKPLFQKNLNTKAFACGSPLIILSKP